MSTSNRHESKPWHDPRVIEACRGIWQRAGAAGLDPDAIANGLSQILGAEWAASLPGERLRWFAIWLEQQVSPSWDVIRGLYAQAARLDPNNAAVLRSWALAALEYSGLEAERRKALLAEAARVAEQSTRIGPGDAEAYHVLGLALYADEERPIEAAERAFRRAVTLDPAHAAARRYLAHALEDLERWEDALAELGGIEEGALITEFEGGQVWRIGVLREAIAVCLIRLGRSVEAERAVERFLEFAERAGPGELEAPRRLCALASQLPNPLARRVVAVRDGKPLLEE